MAQKFPRFYDLSNEDSEKFMEALKFTTFIKDQNAPEMLLQILSFCLVGEACAWMREFIANFQEEDDRRAPGYVEVRAAFLERFPCDVGRDYRNIMNGKIEENYRK